MCIDPHCNHPTMDPGKGLDNNGCSSEVPGLQGSVLTAAPLSVVVLPKHHPGHFVGLQGAGRSVTGHPTPPPLPTHLVVPSSVRDGSKLPRELIANIVGLVIFSIDRSTDSMCDVM